MKDPLIGQQLANFRVERLLGQGGMATVYLGLDIKLQRAVAIKVIDKHYKNQPAYAARFVNEARMMAKWRHENIIQIYYADDIPGYSYYVMEYVDGQDLSSVMSVYADDGELMPIADVLRIGNAIASGLDYAHRQGVVHRDIKPSNVLIAKDGRVLIGDFGMALEVRDGSMGSIFGTPHYISPEQAKRSADAVPQSDLYSLGVVLYEILTGTAPFNDPSPASIALQHITEAPPPPRSINPELSPAVEAVLLKALEKNPQDRYQSGAKLMAALSDAFKSANAPVKLSLPPLPVGAPTIRRSAISIEQIAKREAPKGVTVYKPIAEIPPAKPPRRKNRSALIFMFLMLLGIGGWYFANQMPFVMAETATPTFTSAPPTLTEEPVQPTQTLSQPSATVTPKPATPSPEPSQTPAPATATATEAPAADLATVSPTAEVDILPTIKYPDGNHFSLLWNESSFILLNRSTARRSYSGFTFERLNESGEATDRFYGYSWFDTKYKDLPPRTCLSINIHGITTPPYLTSSDCVNGYLIISEPDYEKDQEMLFWTIKEGSTKFRVLWLNEEIAQCEISAASCEIYIP
jgi:serine/threonine protein kinase